MPKNKFPCYYYYFFNILFGYSRVKYFSNSIIVGTIVMGHRFSFIN